MRRLATRKARWLYALGRIFANVAPTNLQVYEQRHATEAAVATIQGDTGAIYGPSVSSSTGRVVNVRYWHLADTGLCAALMTKSGHSVHADVCWALRGRA